MARLIGINILVLCSLFALVELGFRTSYFFRTCSRAGCDYGAFAPMNFLDKANIGLSQGDPVVGRKPNPGQYFIDFKDWRKVTVTIKDDTSRSSGNADIARPEPRILAVGDSFTFGAQVSDDETWPSALERRLRVEVVNGGVSGYGSGQAVLRARSMLRERGADMVILSVLLPGDLERDQLLARSSRPRPVWLKSGDGVRIAYPAETAALARKLIDENRQTHLPHWVGYSYILYVVNKKIFGYAGGYYIKHPDAASVEDISCAMIGHFARLDTKPVLFFQYAVRELRKPRRKIADHVESCAAAHNIPVLDSYEYLRSIENYENLFFGHMKPEGNEIIAEFLETELRKLYPDMFD